MDWFSECPGGAGFCKRLVRFISSRLKAKQGRVKLKFFLAAVDKSVGPWFLIFPWKKFYRLHIMGGEPVITEPSVLIVDEDVRVILEEAGLLSFFKKFSGHSDSITSQFVESWKSGRVSVNGVDIEVSATLIAEVSGLPNDGEAISRDKMNQVDQLTKFIRERNVLLVGFWNSQRVSTKTLGQGGGAAILNSLRNREKVNFPLFLFKSMEKSVNAAKARKGKNPLYQGLMKLIVDFDSKRKCSSTGSSKGVFVRVSGAPISKSQLLLGLVPPSPHLVSVDTASDLEGDSGSQERTNPVINPKEKGSKKRKPPPQVLSANIAKCSRRSTRLQWKTVGISNVVVDADSSEEDHKSDVPRSMDGRNSPLKGSAVAPSRKDAENPAGPHHLSEELRCHLRVLNGLSGSLSSTCACLNLLAVELTKHLKDVAKEMKDLNSRKE
eukprot:Gb_30895 [translate_table: standard]